MTAHEYLERMKKLYPQKWGNAKIEYVGSVRPNNPYSLPQEIVRFSVIPSRPYCFFKFPWDYMEKKGMVAKSQAYWRHLARVVKADNDSAKIFSAELKAIERSCA